MVGEEGAQEEELKHSSQARVDKESREEEMQGMREEMRQAARRPLRPGLLSRGEERCRISGGGDWPKMRDMSTARDARSHKKARQAMIERRALLMEEVASMPKVREMLATSQQILGYDLLQVCLQGPDAKLEETEVCFPAVHVASLAALEKLRERRPEAAEAPGAVAGLALGEFAALTAAGVWDFDVGLTLVKTCGEAVSLASKASPQATLSIAGIEKAALESECAEAGRRAGAPCQIAHELFPKGATCAGAREAVAELKRMVEGRAVQARILRSYGAHHTAFMEPARKRLHGALKEALPKMRPPRCDVYMNSTGAVLRRGTDPSEVAAALCSQLTSRVLWESCVNSMIAAGAAEFYEVGPMKQLKAMMKRIDATSWTKMANVEI